MSSFIPDFVKPKDMEDNTIFYSESYSNFEPKKKEAKHISALESEKKKVKSISALES